MRVSVIGGSTVDHTTRETAVELGRQLAERGHTVVCGGLGGVMAAVCEGARERDGHTIGILPGDDPAAANDHVETTIATGLGHARNTLVVMNGDAVVAVAGSGGTLSEIGFAFVFGRPIAGLGSHDIDGVEPCESVEAAVNYVEEAALDRG